MSAYTRAEIAKIEKPSCFADRQSYNYFSLACKACSVAASCAHDIEIDDLLAELPGDLEDNELTVSSDTHGLVQERPTSDEDVVFATVSGAVTMAEVSTTVTPPYAFPAPDSRRYFEYTNDALVEELKALIGRGELTTSSKHYDSVRAEICAIHIEMNLRQQYAPRFRPQAKLRKTPESGNDENLGRDRQVIDLHWRANSSDKPMSTVIGYERIFDAEQFDFELASAFAQLDWRPHTKVIQLHLTEDMQWENAIIQAPNIRDKWRTIERGDVRGSEIKQAGAPHIRTCLHQAMANAPHLREHVPGLVRVWMARRIVGDMPKRVARLVALMTGEKARDVSAIRRAIDSLDARLTAARALRK
jgi:hypothetical protein